VAIAGELSGAYPSRSIQLSCPTLPGTWDPDRLEQVFSNLIGNALIHGANSPVLVEARVAGDEMIEVEVHNGGPSIPPELHSSLFDPFRRGERDSRTSRTSGLGLGLYICHELVRAHHGTLECRSDAVSGTTFTVTLPRTTPSSRP
jgi:sigma-B regulation protein RsbU (phosphoserine phosphatase)